MMTLSNLQLKQINIFNNDYFTSWIKYIDASKKTVETYKKNIKQFLLYLQSRGINQPTREDIITYRDYLIKEHKPTTAQGYLTTVKLFFNWLSQEGLYSNIAEHIKGVKLDSNFKKDYLTAKQASKLIKSIDPETLKGKRDYALISLMLTTGLRTIEIARANIEDLRPAGDYMALYIQGKGRTDKAEYVKISDSVELAIRNYLIERGTTQSNEPLFNSLSNNDKGRLTTRSISRIVKDTLLNAGFNSDRLTAHSLRHTTATLNLLNGGTLEETSQLLRHKSLTTTLIYSHALERAKNNSEQRISNAIFTNLEEI